MVTFDELAENDFNCNIRRYVDSSPPPEPHDVRAHLHGGIPTPEIEAAQALFEQAGLDPATLFAKRGDGYANWRHDIKSPEGREAAQQAITYAVARRIESNPWPRWWAGNVEPMLRSLPEDGSLVGRRDQLVQDFTTRMAPTGMDRFAAAGMAATWWEESFFDLQTAASRGWKAVVEVWLTSAQTSQKDEKPDQMSPDEALAKAIGELRRRIEKLVADHFSEIERNVIAWYDNLVDKYGVTLHDLKEERDTVAARLAGHLTDLGYV